jgi:hypothetical protein
VIGDCQAKNRVKNQRIRWAQKDFSHNLATARHLFVPIFLPNFFDFSAVSFCAWGNAKVSEVLNTHAKFSLALQRLLM